MSQSLKLAKQQLLDPVGLDSGDIQNTLDKLMAHDVDSADLYFEPICRWNADWNLCFCSCPVHEVA